MAESNTPTARGTSQVEVVIGRIGESQESRSRNRRQDAANASDRIRSGEIPTAAAQEQPNSDQTRVDISDVTPSRPRGRKAAQIKAEQDAKAVTPALVGMMESMAVMTIGPEAKFAPMERAMIDPSLARILARMPKESIDKFGGMLDPMVLALGLGMWGLRIRNTQIAKRHRLHPDVVEAVERASGGLDARHVATSSPETNGNRRDTDGVAAPPNDTILQQMNGE